MVTFFYFPQYFSYIHYIHFCVLFLDEEKKRSKGKSVHFADSTEVKKESSLRDRLMRIAGEGYDSKVIFLLFCVFLVPKLYWCMNFV